MSTESLEAKIHRRTELARERAYGQPVCLQKLTRDEIALLRPRLGDVGIGADFLVTTGAMLPLAIVELARLRGRTKVTVKVTPDGFQLRTKRKGS